MISNDELRYMLALQRAPNLGDTSARKIVSHVGTAKGVFKEKRHKLLKISGIGSFKLKDLEEKYLLDEAERELDFIHRNQISVVTFKEDHYPERLRHCADAPLVLFYRGELPKPEQRILSIVGTRTITSYGRSVCEQLIDELSALNPVIVSGFAYGVDITAHMAAVNMRLTTIACLAHGFDQWYPRSHAKYVDQILEQGCFISEFWSDDAFDRSNFLRRNRIIAGISEATIVIESAEKGGSLVTADIANSYNREVFAIPGRIGDLKSKGCNDLIRSQQAHLVTSAADIVYMLNWSLEQIETKPRQKQLFVELNPDEQHLFDFLQEKDDVHLDTIALACNMPTFTVASLLLQMELKGIIRPLPGKRFEAV